jgi:FtsP/CotA-like multicopper oxidase with cupredoxin domain
MVGDEGAEYEQLPLYDMNEEEGPLAKDDPLSHDSVKRPWGRTTSRFLVGLIVTLVITLLGLLIIPGPHNRSVNFGESEKEALEQVSRTVYGRELKNWQLDTSREYHLGKAWNNNAPPTVREYNFTISELLAAPNGVQKRMTVVNGQFPGPLVEANEGDRVVVHVTNEGSEPTSLHFHGMHQNGTNHMDGATAITQCPIQPGKSFTYDFTVQGQWGTYWYHSHYSTQYVEGFAGPFIIHSRDEDQLMDHYDEDVVIFLSDLYHDSSFDLLDQYIAPGVENQEPIPDSGLIQGTNYFDCNRLGDDEKYNCTQRDSERAVIHVIEDKTYRFRLISAGAFSEFDFSIDDHVLTVVEADGTNTEPLNVETVRLSNAQRYSVLVKTKSSSDSGGFWLRASMNTYCYDGDNPNLDANLKAILSYPTLTQKIIDNDGHVDEAYQPRTNKSRELDGSIRCQELDPSLLVPAVPIKVPPADEFIAIDASFQIGARAISLGYFNDSTYIPTSGIPNLQKLHDAAQTANQSVLSHETNTPAWADNQFIVTIDKPKVIDLLINNYDDGAHPFHLHGYKMWELAHGQGYFEPEMYSTINTTNPIRRDTIQMSKYTHLCYFIRTNSHASKIRLGLSSFHRRCPRNLDVSL